MHRHHLYIILLLVAFLPVFSFGQTDNKDSVYQKADVMPEFPGGENAMMRFLMKNLHYPEIGEKDSEIRTHLIICFVVNKDGSVSDIVVKRSISQAFDKEAIRVVKLFPRFRPGEQNGVAVRVQFVLPMSIELAR